LFTKGAIGEAGFQKFDAAKMLDESPEYILFNGRVKALADHPLKAEAGEKVRVFFGNAGVSKVSSLHLIGEIFDRVYPEAASATAENVQTTLVPAGGAAIVEFVADVPGAYVLVDHALARLDRGAWGLLEVSGSDRPDIIAPVK
jgi:nitrite reductase (NO-forming)